MSTIQGIRKEVGTSWANIIISLFCIFFLRLVLESYSSPVNQNGDFVSWQGFLLHIPLSYLAIFFSLLLALFYITRAEIKRIASFLTFAHLLILIPPLADFLISGRRPNSIVGYQVLNIQELPSFFWKTISSGDIKGITLGMQLAIFLLSLLMGTFVFKVTRNKAKTTIGFFSTYLVMFLYANIPSLIVFFQAAKNDPLVFPERIFSAIIGKSWIANSLPAGSDAAYDLAMAQIFFLLVVLQSVLIFYLSKKEICRLVFRNMRPERILNYGLLATIGIIVAQGKYGELDFFNIINIISLTAFVVLLAANILVAIFVNDSQDVAIDKISNTERPLALNAIGMGEWKNIGAGILFFFVYGLLTFNFRVIFFMFLMQLLFFVYSVGPLKLRRHFITASLVLGATTASVSLAGFFLVSGSVSVQDYPVKILLTLLFSQAILSNMKDIKDYEGDRMEGIRTLPVVFGLEKAKKIIALLYAIVFVTIPVIFSLDYMVVFSLCASALVYYLFTKKIFQEKYIFLVMFLYMLLLALAA